ncbi:MAG: glycosyl-4,4'-diaponeurosporenoate acyltransferase [Acidobacteriota bacterium]
MTAWIWTANLLGWPVIQLSISFFALRLPAHLFAQDLWMTAPRRWERGGHLYRDWLGVRRWKLWLPDGAFWMGGFTKKRLNSRDRVYLARFVLETRRAELAHWSMLLLLPLFFLWNPPWAWVLMTAYAFSANLPCIVAQRYNRIVLERVLESRRRILGAQ